MDGKQDEYTAYNRQGAFEQATEEDLIDRERIVSIKRISDRYYSLPGQNAA